MPTLLVPLVGPFHLRFPRYNAVTVRDVVAAARPDRLLTSARPGEGPEGVTWFASEEVAIPLAVSPWATAEGRELIEVGEPSPDPAAQADLERYLGEAPAGREAILRVQEARAPVEELLKGALDLGRIERELVPALEELRRVRLALFGDGPGTDWSETRGDAVALRVRSFEQEVGDGVVVVLTPVDEIGPLVERLDGARFAPSVPPGEASRRRALLDSALGGEAKDPEAMLRALRELPGAEARLAEADLLLARGHPAEALDILENASRGDFSRPYHVPGWLLARLGQLYDLAGRRDDALRAYRGALALSWAPPTAREAASKGLERPFTGDAA